jgi:hypothetical protein
VLIELRNKLVSQHTGKIFGFVLPRWVKMYMDVDLSLSNHKKIKDIRRLINKYSFDVEKVSSYHDFVFFYEKMYRPYIASRHRQSAVIEDCKKMLHDFRSEKSAIYFILYEGIRIAGLYEQTENGIPYMHALGVLNGDEDLLKMGVISVLYYYALVDHHNNKIKRVNIGGTSPLLQDGLTRF